MELRPELPLFGCIDDRLEIVYAEGGIVGSDHLKRLSAHGDPLDELGQDIDFEAFRFDPVPENAFSGNERNLAKLKLI